MTCLTKQLILFGQVRKGAVILYDIHISYLQRIRWLKTVTYTLYCKTSNLILSLCLWLLLSCFSVKAEHDFVCSVSHFRGLITLFTLAVLRLCFALHLLTQHCR